MRNVAMLAIVSIFVFSIALSGCGKLGKKDFEAWKEPYVAQNAQEHSEVKNEVSNLDSKVDQQRTSLTESIAAAKDEAIATSQQGDADTIQAAKQFAQDEDANVREELTKTANMAGEKAQDFAKMGDDDLRKMINDLEQQTKVQAANLNKVEDSITAGAQEAKAFEEEAAKRPIKAGTVQFSSGRAGLTQAAKQELDKAVTMIQQHLEATIIVKGHADGRPVLGGRYRSNWDLSQARANAVVKYLTDKGVKNTIEARAVGHTEPIAPVNTAAGRAKNRRAEVIIYPSGTVM
ncbi:MAG: OmpA family protein [Candidatus Poribacteria bacterium]|nr:OmpA family protein [Candidatus Poribacteria bacterium]